MADYTMGEFIANVKDIQAAQSDPKEILQRVAPLAKKIAGVKAWLNDSHYRVEQSVGIGITIIHEEPGGLQVATVLATRRRCPTARSQDLGCVVGIDERRKMLLGCARMTV